MELDGRNANVEDQVAFFERAKIVTTSTSIALRYVNFNQQSVRKAAVACFRSRTKFGSETPPLFEELSLLECPESPFIEMVLASAVDADIFRSIVVKGPPLQMVRRIYVSMLLFDDRRGGFPRNLSTLILDNIMLSQRDADFLSRALSNEDDSSYPATQGANKNHCTLKSFAMRNIVMGGDGTLERLCEGFRRNTSLNNVEVMQRTFWKSHREFQMLLEALSRHPHLKSLQLASLFTFHLKEILRSIQPSHDLNVLNLTLLERNLTLDDANFIARQTKRILSGYPQISHIIIRPRGNHQDGPSVFDPVPLELVSQIHHFADINYAGRRLVLFTNGRDNNDCQSESKAVPIGLWPLVIERALKHSWPERDCCWIPNNRFNGIYYLLRWGPVLLLRDIPPQTQK
jgi:hypothetical protein